MNVPTDRLLIMLIALTGFAVLIGGWAGGLVDAEATGVTELGLGIGLGAILIAVLVGVWYEFYRVDEDSSR